MRCEVCGRKIHGSQIRVVIEGARLTVCMVCSKHGRVIQEEAAERLQRSIRQPAKSFPLIVQKKKPKIKVEFTQELVERYDLKIRHAREKLGLSQEELGKKINEKASVLSKLETGKMTPNNMLVTKLEYALKIKLLVPISKEKVSRVVSATPTREPTLGDLMNLNKKDGEAPEERKP